ncbi:helix-turn-helix domain-containing protein [Paraflavisolibacter sp. H34]|uniref:helix-turn-helix domain-containing protein n=1 Tax=Huijunlia imazamoxiresistens TaxID=3127457 RepID=UPI0030174883
MDTLFIPTEIEFKKWIREVVEECLEGTFINKLEPDGEKPLITRKDVARLLGVSLVTLNDWAKKGLPSYKLNGRVYFQRSEVLEYVKSCRSRFAPQFPSS